MEIGRKITGMIAAVNHVACLVFITLPEPSHKTGVCRRQQMELKKKKKIHTPEYRQTQ